MWYGGGNNIVMGIGYDDGELTPLPDSELVVPLTFQGGVLNTHTFVSDICQDKQQNIFGETAHTHTLKFRHYFQTKVVCSNKKYQSSHKLIHHLEK